MSEQAQQLVVETEKQAPIANTESVALISMIERAARDPAVDINKMEQLFAMHERMQDKQAKREFLAAFAEMQPKLPVIARNGTLMTNEKKDGQKTGNQIPQSKYATWEDICEAITPVLAQYHFSLSFRIDQPSPDRVLVTAVLGHKAGHEERTSFGLPIDTSGSKNNVQGWASSVSYGKRYTGTAMLNIVSRGEDDDGNRAGSGPTISEDQLLLLRDKMESVEASDAQFCKYLGVSKLTDLAAKHYDRAVTALNKKGEQKL